MDVLPPLLTQSAFAQVMRLSIPRTIRPAIRARQLKAVAVGKRLMIPSTEVARVQREGLGGMARLPAKRSPRVPPAPPVQGETLDELLARRAAAVANF